MSCIQLLPVEWEIRFSTLQLGLNHLMRTYGTEDWVTQTGRPSRSTVRKFLSSNAVQNPRERISVVGKPICRSSAIGKQSRVPRPANPVRATNAGEIVHSDVCGPMPCPSLGGSLYYVSFVDECSRYVRIIPIQKKSDVAQEFHKYLDWVERRTETKMKRFHSDSGGEYMAL